jgi:hypothetical protein
MWFLFYFLFWFFLYCPIQWKHYVNQLYTVICYWLYCSLWASWLTIKHLFVVCLFVCLFVCFNRTIYSFIFISVLLRISAHRLHIETGRYQDIHPHQRLCGLCDSGEVEDEIHFLLCCSKFREDRQQLFRTISQSCNNFLQLNPQEIFYWLMTCEDVSVLKELCHFIYKYCR